MLSFPLHSHIRWLMGTRDRIKTATSWFFDNTCNVQSSPPTVLKDIRDGSMWREQFLPQFGESKYNLCYSLCGDGVQKHRLTDSNMFPVMVRVDSLPPEVRDKTEYLHLLMLLPHGVKNYDVFMAPAIKELRMAAMDGIKLRTGPAANMMSRCCLLCASGDLRAIPGTTTTLTPNPVTLSNHHYAANPSIKHILVTLMTFNHIVVTLLT